MDKERKTRHVRRASKRWCSFCGKESAQVDMLIEGPGVAICNECIDLMRDMVHNPQPPRSLAIDLAERRRRKEARG